MRKDVSGGGEAQVQKIRKSDEKRLSGGGEVQVQKSEKNEKRRFTRWRGPSSKNSKMMRKDVSGGQRSKLKNPKKC
jgi:hypothetical protein